MKSVSSKKFKYLSSVLFAMSLFGGMGHADSKDLSAVSTTFTYDIELLNTADGAEKVLNGLERQARQACRQVSMVSVGLTYDKVCAQDLLFQAVSQIGDASLAEEYAASDYYVEGTSERIQVAAR